MKIEPGSLDSFLSRMKEDSEELQNMINYCRGNSCMYNPSAVPSKTLMRSHGVYQDRMTGFIWWVLEQYFKGNITIRKDEELQSVK